MRDIHDGLHSNPNMGKAPDVNMEGKPIRYLLNEDQVTLQVYDNLKLFVINPHQIDDWLYGSSSPAL